MRSILAAIALVLTLTPASAYIIGNEYAMPPAKYRHAYKGPLKVRTLPLRELQRICGSDTIACALVTREGKRIVDCEVYYASGITGSLLPQVRIHEMAHCNGYPADHSGSVMEKRGCCSPLDRRRGR
jgi:hypothetical protein